MPRFFLKLLFCLKFFRKPRSCEVGGWVPISKVFKIPKTAFHLSRILLSYSMIILRRSRNILLYEKSILRVRKILLKNVFEITPGKVDILDLKISLLVASKNLLRVLQSLLAASRNMLRLLNSASSRLYSCLQVCSRELINLLGFGI